VSLLQALYRLPDNNPVRPTRPPGLLITRTKMALKKTTKLTSVNRILSNIGQAPVTVLDTGNPLVEMAELILDEVTIAIQSEGWVFNTEYQYPFTPDNTGIIAVPDTVLALDSSDFKKPDSNLVTRGGRLYDKAAHSFQFTGTQNLDVVWLVDFVDMPEAFREYATIRAANVFAGRSVGSQEAVAFGQREEVLARATAIEYDTQQGDYNMIAQNKDGYGTYQTYRPSFASMRR